eukprot:TRINITY_DN10061_c0_g1_i1.p1 TRINITY_DN10061_c0_g1~~TRINITY_DN10061_c0_g1_i1.p1  ORF type:complete len:799 (+),score=146.11 TRINITY_DN10061_c0_g1_i1:33-2399(+)
MVVINVPIIVLILVTTLLSLGASIAGGLIMYSQGLESLEDGVREMSVGQVASLRSQTNALLKKVKTQVQASATFLHSSRTMNTVDGADWAEKSRAILFAEVNSSEILEFISFHVLPREEHNTSVFYAAVVKETENDAFFSEYGHHLNDSVRTVTGGNITRMDIQVYDIDIGTGFQTTFSRTQNLAVQYNAFMSPSVFDPETGTQPMLWQDDSIIPESYLSQWTFPLKRQDASGQVYAYFMLLAIYLPPPPPHPWSTYRAIMYTAGISFSEFEHVFSLYGQAHPDTIAVLVNRVTAQVYASTEDTSLVPDWCQGERHPRPVQSDYTCYTFLRHLSFAVQEAYGSITVGNSGVFLRQSFDGEEYFAIRVNVHTNWDILWLRPVSSVDHKVQRALVLLVVFTCLVFFFDIGLSVGEMLLVGMPLRNLSSSIAALGQMETDAALQYLRVYDKRTVMVTEVRRILLGTRAAALRVAEYRTFLPTVLHQGGETSGLEPATNRNPLATPVSTPRSPSPASSFSPAANSPPASPTGTQLGLHLAGKNVGLLAMSIVRWQEGVWPEGHTLLSTYGTVVTRVIQAASASLGVMESFAGDHFFLGWNTCKAATDIPRKASRTALRLHTVTPQGVSCAIAVGSALVGVIGSQSVRKFTIVSPAVAWVHHLEQYNKVSGNMCTADRNVFSELGRRFHFEVIDCMRDPVSHQDRLLADILKVVEDDAGMEWMYKMEEETLSEELEKQNRFVIAILLQEWGTIQEVSLPERLSHLRRAYVERSFSPTQLVYTRQPQEQDVVVT